MQNQHHERVFWLERGRVDVLEREPPRPMMLIVFEDLRKLRKAAIYFTKKCLAVRVFQLFNPLNPPYQGDPRLTDPLADICGPDILHQ